MAESFVHLRVHTEYSLADGIVRIPALVRRCVEERMPAVAVTDLGNMFGMVKFYQESLAAGIKPIIGVDAWVGDGTTAQLPGRLLLLCRNEDGYASLCQLLSRAHEQSRHGGRPAIAPEWLSGSGDGLIALSGAQDGEVGQALVAGNRRRARQLVEEYASRFPGRFYLELQRTGRAHEDFCNDGTLELALEFALPVVATNAVQFLESGEYDAHEVRVCIHEGRVLGDKRRERRFTERQWLLPAPRMHELFHDVPEALANSLEIARRCNFRLQLGQPQLPVFPVPEGTDVDTVLREDARAGLPQMLARSRPGDDDGQAPAEGASAPLPPGYAERLDHELDVIVGMGFAGYFLIVADFIRWARENDIPVGPGRGSGAGSLVAYALGITQLDPIRHELLFERFLNPERVSLPDFDIDFCMEGRDRVIEYVAERYGRERVAQIITFGTMAARAVVRDVGRVLGLSYGFCDQIAKLIPFEVGMTLEKALEQEEALRERYEQDDEVHDLLDMARSLEGLARNVGKHAGGVVIAPSRLTDFTPMYCEPGGRNLVTQFDKDDLEAVGLVKFDFLGLRTLTIINRAVAMANEQRRGDGQPPFVIEELPTDDEDTFRLVRACRTVALFQLESRGMTEVNARLQPDRFEDLVALVALFRPGPMRMVDDFVKRKHGQISIQYLHDKLEPILRSTYGIMLYQEQVMKIAQELAGYSLGAADLLRRAMGKKKPEEMARQREVFVAGARERGVNERVASDIFDLMEYFAGYGFNKSHSAAYALITYQTAWLKAHYPAALMAASLSADMENTDKVVALIAECRELKLEVHPPDINRCHYDFRPVGQQQILYGLGAVKGVGRSAIEAIIAAREEGDGFQDIFDFTQRIDARRVNRRAIESLIRAGALDSLGVNRATLMANLGTALDVAGQRSTALSAGQGDMFGLASPGPMRMEVHQVADWSDEDRLRAEKETLGLYLTGHPIDSRIDELRQFINSSLADVRPTGEGTVTVAGLVVSLRVMNTRRGDKMAFVQLDDRSARVEVAVFSDVFARCRDLIRKDVVLVVRGTVSADEYSGGVRMRAEEVYDLDRARGVFARRLVIDLPPEQAGNGLSPRLEEALKPYVPGTVPVHVHYTATDAEAEIVLGAEWSIMPSDKALRSLASVVGRQHVRLDYR